jgi:hypothetical protein
MFTYGIIALLKSVNNVKKQLILPLAVTLENYKEASILFYRTVEQRAITKSACPPKNKMNEPDYMGSIKPSLM